MFLLRIRFNLSNVLHPSSLFHVCWHMSGLSYRDAGFLDKSPRPETPRSPLSFGTIDTAMLSKLVPRRRSSPPSTRPGNRDGQRSNCTSLGASRYPIYLSSLYTSFKFRLHPKSMKLDMDDMGPSHLPESKSVIEVFGDFLSYLFRCARSFIIGSHAGGVSMWKSVENDIQFILPHPNGWEGAQQSQIRKAAIYAGLVPNTDEGKARITFVTEGEASLHMCVLNGLAHDFLSVSLFPRNLKPRVGRFLCSLASNTPWIRRG